MSKGAPMKQEQIMNASMPEMNDIPFAEYYQGQFKNNRMENRNQQNTSSKIAAGVFSRRKDNLPAPNSIAVYPREVIFEEVQSGNVYEYNLFIRNHSKETKKVRIISPNSQYFSVRYDQTQHNLAPGLSLKVAVVFTCSQVKKSKEFLASFVVAGDQFSLIIPLKAYVPLEIIDLPAKVDLGKLIVAKNNQCKIPIANLGSSKGVAVCCETPYESTILVSKRELTIDGGTIAHLHLTMRSNIPGHVEEDLLFMNGQAIKIVADFVQESVDILDSTGDKLQVIEFGHVFLGEEAKQSIFVINNTRSQRVCQFKILFKHFEASEFKMDEARQRFVVCSLPQSFTKEAKCCKSKIKTERIEMEPYTEVQNTISVKISPTEELLLKFQSLCFGQQTHSAQKEEELEIMVFKSSNSDNLVRIPVKYTPVLPKLTIDVFVFDFEEVHLRTSKMMIFRLKNNDQRSLHFTYCSSENFKISGVTTLAEKSLGEGKILFRPMKAGKYAEKVKIFVMGELYLSLKVFGVCRNTVQLDLKKNFDITLRFNSTARFTDRSIQNEADTAQNTSLRKNTDRNKKLKMVDSEFPLIEQQGLSLPPQKFALFFKKEEYLQAVNQKNVRKRVAPLGIKELSRYAVELSLQEISNIEVSQKCINFGNIFINSVNSKQLTVTNNNSNPILFELDLNNEVSLSGTTRQCIKIDAFAKRTISLVMKHSQIGTVNIPIKYIINKLLIFELQIQAYVTLINLEFSLKVFNFVFLEKQLLFQKSEEILLTNSGNSSIECVFLQQQNKHFSIQSQQISLFPKSTKKIFVTYRPAESEQSGQERIDNETILVKIVGGAQNIIKCTGRVCEAKLSVKDTQFQYPCIFVSVVQSSKISLKNHSKVGTIYCIEVSQQLADYIAIEKETSILESEEKKQISFKFCCHEEKKISGTIWVRARGSRSIRIPFEANVVYPIVEVSRNVLQFGNVAIIGQNSPEIIKMTNLCKSEIRLNIPKSHEKSNYSISFVTMRRPEVDMSKSKKLSLIGKQMIREQRQDSIIRLLPNVETIFEVRFSPKQLKEYDINFPLSLCDALQDIDPIGLKIKCTGVQPVVYIKPESIEFEQKIINETKSTYTKELQILNPHETQIEWGIQNFSKDGVFSFSESKGRLLPHQNVVVIVSFKPVVEGNFHEKFNVVLKEIKTSYISMSVRGSSILPSIKFDCNEVIMPTVPLNVEAKRCLKLENYGYDAITICKWKTSNTFQSVDIKVNFIEGKLLSLAKKVLKVEIVSKSLVAISFTTMLEFYDQYGNKYEIPLSVTADNSICTNYPFIESDLQLTIIYEAKQNRIRLAGLCNSPTEKRRVPMRSQGDSCKFIARWLSYELNLNIKTFPGELKENEGENFVLMINRMVGSEIIKKIDSSYVPERFLLLYNYFAEAIRALKCEGAFLNQIRPEYFMEYGEYKSYMSHKSLLMHGNAKFEELSNETWICLFYQLCKLYIFPQINEKVMKFRIACKVIESEVYSQPEIMILQFLNSYIEESIYSFEDYFKVFEILQKSIQSLFGPTFTVASILRQTATSISPPTFQAISVKNTIDRLKEYGLCLFLEEEDLMKIGTKEVFLYLVSFILRLYHFSSMTSVIFEASIGDKITKIIEVQNPSTKNIKYKVRILGSSMFTPEGDEFVIAPKNKAQFKVAYHCRQNKDEKATLILVPLKENSSTLSAQPLVFALSTVINSKVFLKQTDLSATLYEVKNITLEVELSIDNDFTQFTVFIEEQLTESTGQPGFFCFQSLMRNIKNGRDKLDIKFIGLAFGNRTCKVVYHSTLFGEFISVINVKVDKFPKPIDIQLKPLKIHKDQLLTVAIPKSNEQLESALLFLSEHHQLKARPILPQSKYIASLSETTYITVTKKSSENTQIACESGTAKVELNCLFTKAFQEYSCLLTLKNESLNDYRTFRLLAGVLTKPKVVNIVFRTMARESSTQLIPIKVAPCEITFETPCPYFRITNLVKQLKHPTDLIAVFTPPHVFKAQCQIIVRQKETCQQTIYHISLKGQQPLAFDNIFIEGSTLFDKLMELSLKAPLNEEFIAETTLKRLKIIKPYDPQKKAIEVNIQAGPTVEKGIVKFSCGEQTYWMNVQISSRGVTQLKPISFDLNIKETGRQLLEVSIGQFKFEQQAWLKLQKVDERYWLVFQPMKEMNVTSTLLFSSEDMDYSMDIICKCAGFPSITLPNIVTTNINPKSTKINLINSADTPGTYSVKIDPASYFNLETNTIEMRPREKKVIEITFTPEYFLQQTKAKISFESQLLPNYNYFITGISEFKPVQVIRNVLCNEQNMEEILFCNSLSRKEEFNLEVALSSTPFELMQSSALKFSLEPKASKLIVVRVNKVTEIGELRTGELRVRLNNLSWVYKLVPSIARALSKQEYAWQCKCRESVTQEVQLPSKFTLQSIKISADLNSYFSFEVDPKDSSLVRIKFSPLKAISKRREQIKLVGDVTYVIHSILSATPDRSSSVRK